VKIYFESSSVSRLRERPSGLSQQDWRSLFAMPDGGSIPGEARDPLGQPVTRAWSAEFWCTPPLQTRPARHHNEWHRVPVSSPPPKLTDTADVLAACRPRRQADIPGERGSGWHRVRSPAHVCFGAVPSKIYWKSAGLRFSGLRVTKECWATLEAAGRLPEVLVCVFVSGAGVQPLRGTLRRLSWLWVARSNLQPKSE
jgi:hypothetical protein